MSTVAKLYKNFYILLLYRVSFLKIKKKIFIYKIHMKKKLKAGRPGQVKPNFDMKTEKFILYRLININIKKIIR